MPHPLKGRPLTPEHRANLGAALRGKKFTAEHKANLSKSLRSNRARLASTRALLSTRLTALLKILDERIPDDSVIKALVWEVGMLADKSQLVYQ